MKKTILCMILSLGFGFSLQAQTSENNPQLRDLLKRFPAADTNQDGILTRAEADAFRERRKAQRSQRKARETQTPKGGERHVYKRVGDVELPLYMYTPAGHKTDAKTPAIVFFFGGGWTGGSPTQFEHHCKRLATRGMVAMTVEYRVSSRHPVKVEDCIEDAKSAMRWVRAHAGKLGIDPNRIAASGGSAGGHLAACTAVMGDFNATTDPPKVSSRPDAMVLFNPAVGLAPDDPRKNEFASKGRVRTSVEQCFPLTYASKRQAPCIMFFGTEDRLMEGAELYRKESVKAGNICTILTYEGQGHGFFNYKNKEGKYYKITMAETEEFLMKLGWLQNSADQPSP